MTATGDKDDAARGEPKSGADAKNGIQKSEDYSKEREEAVASSSVTNSQESKMLKARIFIGNLPADLRTERGELFDKFRKHGRILGVSIHSRFAFLQFEREEDAQAAVKAEQRSDFRSAKIDVKMSMDGRQRDRRDDLRDRDREPIRNREPDRDRRRSRSPIDRRPRSPIERRDLNRRRDRDSRERDRDRDYRGNSRYSDQYRMSREHSPVVDYVPSPVEERFCHPRTYGPNDVEMVVIRKQQGQYADSILRRLYERRIAANMLFLAEHASLEGAISEFGRCGSHYVIIIMPKHEETRAITINIYETLTEKPREYRNINVDEGVVLISRHFRDHYPALARLREMEIQGPGFYPTAPTEVMRSLARMVETSAVPTTSLDAAIRYMQDMRDRTAIAEGLPVVGVSVPVVPAVAPPQAQMNAYRPSVPDAGLGKIVEITVLNERPCEADAFPHQAIQDNETSFFAKFYYGGPLNGTGKMHGARPLIRYAGGVEESRPLTSEDTVRESLIGLLKATGIVGGLGGNQSAYSTSATAADYHQPGGYSTASKQLEQLPGTASQYTPSSGNQYGQTAAATSQYGQTAGTGSQYGQTTVAGSQFGQAAGASAQYGQAPGAPQYGQTGTGSAQYGQTAAGAQYAATPAASQYGASTAVAPQYSTVGASQYAPVERGSGAVTQFTSERAAAAGATQYGSERNQASVPTGHSNDSASHKGFEGFVSNSSLRQGQTVPSQVLHQTMPEERQTAGTLSYGSRSGVKEENGMDYGSSQQHGLRFTVHEGGQQPPQYQTQQGQRLVGQSQERGQPGQQSGAFVTGSLQRTIQQQQPVQSYTSSRR